LILKCQTVAFFESNKKVYITYIYICLNFLQINKNTKFFKKFNKLITLKLYIFNSKLERQLLFLL